MTHRPLFSRFGVQPQRLLVNLWAGAASAVIFYAEYLGLGASLGESLFGKSATATATGSLLVLLAVVLACLLAVFSRTVYMAGPRGASVVVAGGLAGWLGTAFSASPQQQVVLLGLMLTSAAVTVLAAMHKRVRSLMSDTPAWLIQGFMYATAASIIAGAVNRKLYGCLKVDELTAWAIFLPAVALGVLWKPVLKRWAERRPPGKRRASTLLQPLGLLAAAALSWAAYEATALALPHGADCKRMGETPLDWTMLGDRAGHAVSVFSGAVSPSAFIAALLVGLLLGVVLLIEDLTTFKIDNTRDLTQRDRKRMLVVSAAANIAAATVGASSSSYSTSRTVALRNLGGDHRLAVLMHGVAVAAIALLADRWVAQVPGLTVAVALTLVGTQMIGHDTVQLWRLAYRPTARPRVVQAGWMFWCVLGVSIAFNQPLLGFASGVVVMLVHRHWLEWRKALVNSVAAMVIGLVAAWLVPKIFGEEFLVREVARIYAPVLGYHYGAHHRDEVSVMLIDDTSLASAHQAWPADYGYYGRLLDGLVVHRPKAVFLDVILAAERKDPTLDRLVASACRAREAGVQVYLAARRDAAGRFLLRPELEALVPRCLQKVAVDYDPDAADQMAWAYRVSADSYAAEGEVRGVAGTIYRDMGGKLPAHQHSEMALTWGSAPAGRGIDWAETPAAPEHGEAHADAHTDAHADEHAKAAEPAESYCRTPGQPYYELFVPAPVRGWWDGSAHRPACVFHNTLYPSDLQAVTDADEKMLARHVTDRVVMVGTALLGSNDRILTPLHGRIPGVYLHAMALDNLLTYGAGYRRAAHMGWSHDGLAVIKLVFAGLVLIVLGRLASKRLKERFEDGRLLPWQGSLRRRHKPWRVLDKALSGLVWKLCSLLVYSGFFLLMLLAGQWLALGFLTVIHVALFSFTAEWLEWTDSISEWFEEEHEPGLSHPHLPTDFNGDKT